MGIGKRLLVVGDSEDMNEVVVRVAHELGYEIWADSHGMDFIRSFDRFKPSAVVVDIVMPEVDGVDLVRWMRDRDHRPKVILASAIEPETARLVALLGEAGGRDGCSKAVQLQRTCYSVVKAKHGSFRKST